MDIVFSYAQNGNGCMVHVDDVPRGLACNCVCPNCKEKLLARHGAERTHHFAHHSETRKATLEICYMVTLYKLAEQIVSEKKRIRFPSYYGIFKETDITFDKVTIDGSYEREDKQPDIVATTHDGKQYLIEFIFKYKVQHKKPIDYVNLSCLEVDLSSQNLETLEDFLLNSNEDRIWANNDNYFSQIEARYAKAGKSVRVMDKLDCEKCDLKKYSCCCVRAKETGVKLTIENNGHEYLLCKTEAFEQERKRLGKILLEKQKQEEKQRRLWLLENYLVDSLAKGGLVNSELFSQVEAIYANKGMQVKKVDTCVCGDCPFRFERECFGVCEKDKLVVLQYNGRKYRICEFESLKQELLNVKRLLEIEGWNGLEDNDEARRYGNFLKVVREW